MADEINLFPEHSRDDVLYQISLLMDAGYIVARDYTLINDPAPERPTITGHDFLDSLRDKTILNTVKQKIERFGESITFDIIQALATDIIKKKLGIE